MRNFGVLDHGGPSESHHQQDNVYHRMSTHYDFENEKLDGHVLTQLPINDVFTRDLADAQSQEDNSNYDKGDDEEEENAEPDLMRKHDPPPVIPRVYTSHVSFHSRHIPYLDHLSSIPDVNSLTRDFDEIRTAMWDESRPTVRAKGMFFPNKARLSRAAKMYTVKECCEMMV
uniref:Uncharacterized protein n=1 Tax=Nicotiana tabacum TaxID=4097 RepID=A0A1S4AKV6_TOBAC|nr:PREDICTED: uncharacterized protein LOC107798732 [Nicotiana tabacum]